MIEDWLRMGIIFAIIPVTFFIFVMFVQKIFIGLMKIKNKLLRWTAVVIAIILVSIGINMLWATIFSGMFSFVLVE